MKNGAGDEIRTRDVHLGKGVLYQLSYARINEGGDSYGGALPLTRPYF